MCCYSINADRWYMDVICLHSYQCFTVGEETTANSANLADVLSELDGEITGETALTV